MKADRVGNLVAKYRHGGGSVPIVFVAHMDHPGFEMSGGNRAEFLGGVPREYFPGAKIRVYGRDGLVRARIRRVHAAGWPRRKRVELFLARGVRLNQGEFGMWDVPAFRVQRDRLQAAAIDDVLGVAVVLATLAEAVRRKLRTQVWGVFTRAEEVGFPGAVAVAESGIIPRQALVISVEMSPQRPWARIGDGPVIRVGDRVAMFDPAAAYFLGEVARRCAEQRRGFQSQRCLMDGGTCEATAFASYGYPVGGLCLPLGNYHNRGPAGKIRAEYVSVNDLTQLVELAVAAAAEWPDRGRIAESFQARVRQIRRESPRKLRND